MAKNFKFENVEVIIADQGAGTRTEIRNILNYQGFRNFKEADKLGDVEERVAKGDVDLIMVDLALSGGDVCGMVYRIRHHELGNNPFIVVLALALNPALEDIHKVIESGSDDLILKPITAGSISQRVINLVTERKRFVVTSDYIGPTRRSSHRPGTERIPEIVVPNPLQAKAEGNADPGALRDEIDRQAVVMNLQKMGRHAIQVRVLVDRITAAYDSDNGAAGVAEILDRLVYVTEDIDRRMRDTIYDHASGLCASMGTVVASLQKDPLSPSSRDLKLLPELAQAIEAAFESEDAAAAARDISQSVEQRSR